LGERLWKEKQPHARGGGRMFLRTVQQAKRFFKVLFGLTLLLAGLIMLVTPGPGWLTIALGLAVLAAEFVWARRLLNRLKAQGIRLRDTILPPNSTKHSA
jgi:uncharacterized protein (TIGR02611 family)